MGSCDPYDDAIITDRETHGSGTNYHVELAKQLATFLERPLSECGGIMTLADVYCRYNRARGMEVGLCHIVHH